MRNECQATRLRQAIGFKTTQVIAVASGKGGVGKTNVAANLAVAFGKSRGNAMLLDADLALANVDVLLDLQPRFNLSHVVNGESDLLSTMLPGPAGISIVPASSGNWSMVDLPPVSRLAIIQAFSDLETHPDALIVDTPAGISGAVAQFVTAAQRAVVVVCDEPASITDAYALIKVLANNHGLQRFDIVTNQTRSDWEGRVLFSKLERVADQYLNVVLRHLGNVPYDEYLKRAVQEQCAVVDAYPQCAASRAFTAIAARIEKDRREAPPSGGIQFFFEQLLRTDTSMAGGVA